MIRSKRKDFEFMHKTPAQSQQNMSNAALDAGFNSNNDQQFYRNDLDDDFD